ncbi:MAG: hypothetical protein JW746_03000 [Candidatus Krumholzibacteriota bacterium]|nr:hypothetical protein [Candidatus Krumholzibacteriota bacterium]
MVKRLILVLVLVSFLAAAAEAVPVYRGKRGRSCLRHCLLSSRLTSDKLATYETYGYPVHRIRVNGYGRVLEHWTYYEIGREFIFDEDSKLVKVNKFWPEDKRERFNRR